MDEYQNPHANKYFSMIEHIVIDKCIGNPFAYMLYSYYKRICGQKGGTCYQSRQHIQEGCGISTTTQKKCNVFLEEKGLIKVTHRTKEDGSPDTALIEILDIMPENVKKFETQKSHSGSGSRDVGGVGRETSEGGSRDARKEEPMKKNSFEEESFSSFSSLSSSSSSSSDEGEVRCAPGVESKPQDEDVDDDASPEEEEISGISISRIKEALEKYGFSVAVVDETILRLKRISAETDIKFPHSYAKRIASSVSRYQCSSDQRHSPSCDKASESTETGFSSNFEERKQVADDYAHLFKDVPAVEIRENGYEMIIVVDGKAKSIPFRWSDSEWDLAIEKIIPWDRVQFDD